jgi:hypothetical protein
MSYALEKGHESGQMQTEDTSWPSAVGAAAEALQRPGGGYELSAPHHRLLKTRILVYCIDGS